MTLVCRVLCTSHLIDQYLQGFVHLGAGLSVGLSGLAAGYAVGQLILYPVNQIILYPVT